MNAKSMFRENVLALLQARGQRPHDLAAWCRRTDSWLSKILGKDNRNLPIAYLDRIADFFGLAPYQLFQPGISPLTERRKLTERRAGRDRRVSRRSGLMNAADVGLSNEDVAFLLRLQSLPLQDRAEVDALVKEAMHRRRKGGSSTAPDGAAAGSGGGTAAGTRARGRRKRNPGGVAELAG